MNKREELYSILEEYADCIFYINKDTIKLDNGFSIDELDGLISYLEELRDLVNIENGISMNGYGFLSDQTNKNIETHNKFGLSICTDKFINKFNNDFTCYQYIIKKISGEIDYVFDHYNHSMNENHNENNEVSVVLRKRHIPKTIKETHKEAYYFIVNKNKLIKDIIIENGDY